MQLHTINVALYFPQPDEEGAYREEATGRFEIDLNDPDWRDPKKVRDLGLTVLTEFIHRMCKQYDWETDPSRIVAVAEFPPGVAGGETLRVTGGGLEVEPEAD